ncbi:LacI family DNA-binding transcriptional regulator [uncultured Paraglaciecola sp.]|uniref:LacI family DNA-binding transcriptional regulator n=1 Tax=uncultured Paraglaciecola sp. TaxID=1765024 RepID=UPI0030D83921|tara:strand:+ start:36148 stop:37176 length:1029 start_codon:yes stop_codon:yes gene_type:complete
MKSATITDVAKHAGVSKKTVSRVINQEANVRAETRNKVQVSIAALGFKRNPLGMALAKNRSFFIALLSDNPSPGYLMKLQEGILQSCTEEQMGLFVYDCSYRSQSLAKEIEMLIENTLVDGFILTPPLCDKVELLEMLDAKNINYIKIAPKDFQSGESIVFNGTKGSYEMTKYLITLGHKDIAFILGHPDQESARRSETGFRKAFKEANLDVNEALIVQGYYTYQSGIDAASVLLNKTPRPTAIFSANDEMAVGVLYQIQSQGLRVPDDISICGIDDISITTKVWPHITTMRQPLLSIGYQAASMLIKRLKNKKSGIPPMGEDEARIVDGELVIRDSTISIK